MAETLALPRPWHGASDRADDPAVAALRLQRAEVEALLAFRHAAPAQQAAAWWRLQQARRARLGLLGPGSAARLPPLPAAPRGALGRLQAAALRLRLLRIEEARPPRRLRGG